MTVPHVPFAPTVVRTTGPVLSFASHAALGELGTPAATHRAKGKHHRPKVTRLDNSSGCSRTRSGPLGRALSIVTPEIVVRWHRARFRLYSSLISRVEKQVGRKRLSKEIRTLIFRMVAENPNLGAPRIRGELLTLGFDVPERSISRWMKRAPRDRIRS